MKCVFDFPTALGRSERLVFESPLRVVMAMTAQEVVPALEEVAQAQSQGLYAAGFVSFDAAIAFDPAMRAQRDPDCPLVCFGIFDSPVRAAPTAHESAFSISPWALTSTREQFIEDVERLRSGIGDGVAYQVNYTVRSHAQFSGDAFSYYERLRKTQGGEYSAFLDLGRLKILSASPELFFQIRGRVLTTRPMKGTAPRGRWPQEDDDLAAGLLHSEKERAENLMIVDLLRNDCARLSAPHGVRVTRLFEVERYPTVFQMTSTVEARLRDEVGLAQVFSALFPCGSVTGAPKIKSMELIAALESAPRGVYCGAIGVLTPQQTIFNVAIRTVVVDEQRGQAVCGLGSGITHDSQAAREFEEVLVKARFLDESPQPFELLETLLFDGKAFWLLDRHLERLSKSARHFGFPFDPALLIRALDAWRLSAPDRKMRVRLLLAADGTPRLEAYELDTTQQSSDRVVVPFARKPMQSANPFLYHKTTRREEYESQAKDFPGSFDVLLWNDRGEVTEFTRGNLVVEIDGQRWTPPLECGLLGGTFREELLRRGEIAERKLTREEVAAARRIWFVNSVRGWVEVMLDAYDEMDVPPPRA